MPKEVKEYACEYCGRKGFFSIESAEKHETNCIKNPEISAVWEECMSCCGTGNHYGCRSRRPGTIGFAYCTSCGGSGRRKKMTEEQIERIRESMRKAMMEKKNE